MKKNSYIVIAVVLSITVIGLVLIIRKPDDNSIENEAAENVIEELDENKLVEVTSGGDGQCDLENEEGTCGVDEVKEFDVIVKKYSYVPGEIKVNKGDKVKLNLTSTDVAHSFTLIEFGDQDEGGINVYLGPGEEKSIEFTADKTGEFVFGCDVYCGVGHTDMLGKFIVI